MVLCIDEQQKAVIERYGFKVIEFKKWVYQLERVVLDTVDKIYHAIMIFVSRVVDAFQDLVDRMSLAFKEMQEVFDDSDWIKDDNVRVQYPFVRSIGRMYRPNFSHSVIYHRCRDRC